MEPLSKLLLMSTRKRELESAIEVVKNRMNRDAWRILEATKEIQEIDREAEKLNGEQAEKQENKYKYGQA